MGVAKQTYVKRVQSLKWGELRIKRETKKRRKRKTRTEIKKKVKKTENMVGTKADTNLIESLALKIRMMKLGEVMTEMDHLQVSHHVSDTGKMQYNFIFHTGSRRDKQREELKRRHSPEHRLGRPEVIRSTNSLESAIHNKKRYLIFD